MHAYFDGAEQQKQLRVPRSSTTSRPMPVPPHNCAVAPGSRSEIELVADLSHWVCAAERLLEDQEATIGGGRADGHTSICASATHRGRKFLIRMEQAAAERNVF